MDGRDFIKCNLEIEVKKAVDEAESARDTVIGLFEISETEKTFAPVDWDAMLSFYKCIVRANALIHFYDEQFPDSKYGCNYDEEIKEREDWFHGVFTKALNYPKGTSKND